jgi:serine/threonine-protein kinase RsbW
MSCEATTGGEPDGRKPLFHLRVCVPGHKSSISPVVQSLMEVVVETSCASGKEFEIETALREALANAVVHGCGNDPSKVIECTLTRSGLGELVIVVRDPGPGFDPASVPSPVTGENMYSNHGRGLYLIKQLMDDVRFEGGGSEVRMVLRPAKFSSRIHQARPARSSRRKGQAHMTLRNAGGRLACGVAGIAQPETEG